jgi:hypothetical protein
MFVHESEIIIASTFSPIRALPLQPPLLGLLAEALD